MKSSWSLFLSSNDSITGGYGVKKYKTEARLTSTDEADGTEKPCLCVVHLQRQQLTSKSKNQVCEWTKASVMHLCPVESQAI